MVRDDDGGSNANPFPQMQRTRARTTRRKRARALFPGAAILGEAEKRAQRRRSADPGVETLLTCGGCLCVSARK